MPVDFEKLKQDIIAGEANFTCWKCEYNLRGLVGELKTCPECGMDNSIKEPVIWEEDLLNKMKKLETAPTCFFACVLLSLLFITFLLIQVLGSHCISFTIAISGLFVTIFISTIPLFIFLDRSGTEKASIAASRRTIVTGLAACCSAFIVFGVPFLAIPRIPLAGWQLESILSLATIVCFAAGLYLSIKFYSSYKKQLDMFHRDVASRLIKLQWQNQIIKRCRIE